MKQDYAMTNKRSKFKRILAITVLISFIVYVLLDFNIKSNLIHLKEHFSDFTSFTSNNDDSSNSRGSSSESNRGNMIYDNNNNNDHAAYFVNTEGCKMPSFKIVDDRIAQYMFKPEKINCGKSLTVSTLTRNNENQILLNMNKTELFEYYNITDIQKIYCFYQKFQRKNDTTNLYSADRIILNLFNMNTQHIDSNSDQRLIKKISEPGLEYIRIVCHYDSLNSNSIFYKNFHAFPSNNIATITTESSSQTATHHHDGNNLKLSVLILGIDSVSHLNFLRQMNKTANLLRNKLNAFEFYGYNKVGDNTYPNLVPVLTGLDETELIQVCPSLKLNVSYDDCPFIWKQFKDAGYKTLFSEDSAIVGLFNYFRKGFNKQPTDYYTRPLFIEMEKTISHKLKSNFYLCLGSQRPIDVVFDYFKKLMHNTFKKENFFSFLWTSTSTHDYFNTPQSIDEDVSDLINEMNTNHILNKTALFLMSDHGLRWGPFRKTYQGMMEERQPFLFIVLPKWFQKAFPAAILNLKENKHRLTTHFDLHATLLDLLNLNSITASNLQERFFDIKDIDTLPRGISLFLPMPKIRTCEMANIASHWCTCHEKRTLPTNHQKVQRAARFIVKQINKKLEMYPQCRTLYLNSISEANISTANKIIQKEARDFDYLIDMTIRLQTKPGLGEFEATVRLSNTYTILTGTISRTNLYGKQSYCIDNYDLKMYCYCAR